MKDYIPPAGSDRGGKKARTKKKKDPNAPKKSLTAFMFFSSEARKKIKEENPDMSFGDIGKKCGELYRGLSGEEKKRFEDLAKQDKERYKNAVSAFDKRKKDDDDGVDDESDGENDNGDEKDEDEDNDDDDDNDSDDE